MNGTVHQFAPTADQQSQLRRAFSYFGTGVTVVTTMTDDGPLGMTANSFSSISLDPPLVLWSPALRSKRHDAFAEAENYCIHVLAADQLEMAQHFATNGSGFDAFSWQEDHNGAPVLDDCLAVFHCASDQVFPAGDHSIVLGAVTQVTESHNKRPGLMFDQGSFGQCHPLKK